MSFPVIRTPLPGPKAKAIIEDHLAPDDGSPTLFAERVTLSNVMTLFLSIAYLQWAINRYIVDAEVTDQRPA